MKNLNYYLQRHPNLDVRSFVIDEEALCSQIDSIQQAKLDRMLSFNS